MLKFLFGQRDGRAVQKSQRDVITSLLADLNTAVMAMPEKPSVTINPNTGEIGLELPDQMPDEALALPAPTVETKDAA
ncbi:MAG: hypothetical protein AAF386_04700 [Pseudomonadota bacterium]